MRPRRLAVALSSALLACQTAIDVTGDTGDTGDETVGTTAVGGQLPCGEAGSSLLIDGACWCEPSTTWVEPFDPTSFECAPLEPRDGMTCEPYYTWCSSNVENTECCYDPAQDPDGSHDPDGDTSTSDATSTGTTDATSTGSTDATSTGSESSTGTDSSTGATSSSSSSSSSDASTDSSSSSSGATG